MVSDRKCYRYLSLDARQSLLVAAHKVHMVELGDVGTLVGVAIGANHGNLPESVCGSGGERLRLEALQVD